MNLSESYKNILQKLSGLINESENLFLEPDEINAIENQIIKKFIHNFVSI